MHKRKERPLFVEEKLLIACNNLASACGGTSFDDGISYRRELYSSPSSFSLPCPPPLCRDATREEETTLSRDPILLTCAWMEGRGKPFWVVGELDLLLWVSRWVVPIYFITLSVPPLLRSWTLRPRKPIFQRLPLPLPPAHPSVKVDLERWVAKIPSSVEKRAAGTDWASEQASLLGGAIIGSGGPPRVTNYFPPLPLPSSSPIAMTFGQGAALRRGEGTNWPPAARDPCLRGRRRSIQVANDFHAPRSTSRGENASVTPLPIGVPSKCQA